jgi:hypothetical protein
MAHWIREFKHRDTGQRYRVASDAKDIPTLRRLVAEQRNDAEWLDDMIYQYDPSLTSRSIFALMDDHDSIYLGSRREDDDQIGFIDDRTRAIFGRSYAAEPQVLIEQLRKDEAITEADTLLLTVPNQLGVAYNAHVIEAILTHVTPALGWR